MADLADLWSSLTHMFTGDVNLNKSLWLTDSVHPCLSCLINVIVVGHVPVIAFSSCPCSTSHIT